MRKDILELMDDVAGLIEWLKADQRYIVLQRGLKILLMV